MCCCCNFFYLFFIPLLLARSPATTTAAVVQCLTTDSPVTQLNFHSFRACSTLQFIPCVCPFSFPIIPWFRSFVLLNTVWNIHACFNICTGDRTSDGKKFKYATTAVSGQDIIDVRPSACFFSYLSVPTTHRVVFFSFSIYKYVVLPPLFHTFHPVPWSDGCRILFSMATERYHSKVFVPASFLHVLLLTLCHPAIAFDFSLYVVPSFCRFLSTFVLTRFCRYCRCSSRVAAVFSVPRPFRSAFRASRCYLCAPFAVFLLLSALLFNNHRKPAICPTAPRTART